MYCRSAMVTRNVLENSSASTHATTFTSTLCTFLNSNSDISVHFSMAARRSVHFAGNSTFCTFHTAPAMALSLHFTRYEPAPKILLAIQIGNKTTLLRIGSFLWRFPRRECFFLDFPPNRMNPEGGRFDLFPVLPLVRTKIHVPPRQRQDN